MNIDWAVVVSNGAMSATAISMAGSAHIGERFCVELGSTSPVTATSLIGSVHAETDKVNVHIAIND